jgi:SNF2 family DNA or RNA helicase
MTVPKLFGYQNESVSFGIKNPYCILGLEPGLGKTVTSLTVAEQTNSKALIICPSYLKLKWKAEIDKFYPGRSVIIVNSSKEIEKLPIFDTDYIILSVALVEKAEPLFKWCDMVILDEATTIKEMKTKRTEAFHRLIYEYSIKRCLLLTGTPIVNRVYEFYSLIAVCNYNPQMEESAFLTRFPSYVDFANYFSYLKEFEMMRGGRRVKIRQWEGFRKDRKPELLNYIKDIYISYKSEDVLDLPPYVNIDVPLNYADMPDLLIEFDSFKENYSGAQVSAKAKAALMKAPYTIDYVKGLLESVGQVIIYTDHINSCHEIAKGLNTVGITGETPMKTREIMANEFMDK